MVPLLIGTCGVMIINLHHALVYALPSLLTLMVAAYLFFSERLPELYTFIALGVFFIANTLFMYALCREMMESTGTLTTNILRALIWRREHTEFFIFIGIGVIMMAIISIYFLDMVTFLSRQADVMRELQLKIELTARTSFTVGGYSVLATGSRAASIIVFVLTIWLWMRLSRMGIRIPAYTEGYYLRTSEALELVEPFKWSIFFLSFLFIIAGNGIMRLLSQAYIDDSPIGANILAWLAGYFFMAVMHIAMWSRIYIIAVKMRNYPMTRLA